MAKTWQQKLDSPHPPKVEVLESPMMGVPAGARLLIANPRTVQDFVSRIPKGEALTIPELRERMAKAFDADTACPLTTGIFLRIVAECALEEMAAGKSPAEVTPFWRAIDPKSGVGKKLSCGKEHLLALRSADGIKD